MHALEEYIGQKYLFFPQWKEITRAADVEYLKREMKGLAIARNNEAPMSKPGEVIFIYTREDLVVDKLKGNV